MKRAFKVLVSILGGLLLLGFSLYGLLCWLTSEPEFHYGEINYWVLTSSQVRQFPLLGVKRNKVLYHSTFQDGHARAAFDAYLKSCKKLGYQIAKKSSGEYINLRGKGEYESISIDFMAKSIRSSRTEIQIVFTEKLD